MSEDLIKIESGGTVKLPPALLKQMRTPVGTQFSPHASGENVLLLFRHDDNQPEFAKWSSRCTLLGLIGSFGIADLFSTLNMGQKTGVVVFESGHVAKRVYFSGGEIVFADSSDPSHRLGEILVKRGKVTSQQISDVLSHQGSGVRLGAGLIESGLLSANELYENVRHQVEEIIYSIFPMTDGSFFFFEGDFLDDDLSQFTLNTQNILMEGYRRLDEWAQMREKIPHDGVILHVKDDKLPEFDTAQGEHIFSFIDGKRSVQSLVKASGLDEFDVTRAIFDFLRRGEIEAVDPKQNAGEQGDSLVAVAEAYNKLFVIVTEALDRSGSEKMDNQRFQDFVLGLDEKARQALANVTFSKDEGFASSISTMVDNINNLDLTGGSKSRVSAIAGLGAIFKRQQLQSILDELLNYFLFTLKNALPPEQADTFIQKIRAAHRRLRK